MSSSSSYQFLQTLLSHWKKQGILSSDILRVIIEFKEQIKNKPLNTLHFSALMQILTTCNTSLEVFKNLMGCLVAEDTISYNEAVPRVMDSLLTFHVESPSSIVKTKRNLLFQWILVLFSNSLVDPNDVPISVYAKRLTHLLEDKNDGEIIARLFSCMKTEDYVDDTFLTQLFHVYRKNKAIHITLAIMNVRKFLNKDQRKKLDCYVQLKKNQISNFIKKDYEYDDVLNDLRALYGERKYCGDAKMKPAQGQKATEIDKKGNDLISAKDIGSLYDLRRHNVVTFPKPLLKILDMEYGLEIIAYAAADEEIIRKFLHQLGLALIGGSAINPQKKYLKTMYVNYIDEKKLIDNTIRFHEIAGQKFKSLTIPITTFILRWNLGRGNARRYELLRYVAISSPRDLIKILLEPLGWAFLTESERGKAEIIFVVAQIIEDLYNTMVSLNESDLEERKSVLLKDEAVVLTSKDINDMIRIFRDWLERNLTTYFGGGGVIKGDATVIFAALVFYTRMLKVEARYRLFSFSVVPSVLVYRCMFSSYTPFMGMLCDLILEYWKMIKMKNTNIPLNMQNLVDYEGYAADIQNAFWNSNLFAKRTQGHIYHGYSLSDRFLWDNKEISLDAANDVLRHKMFVFTRMEIAKQKRIPLRTVTKEQIWNYLKEKFPGLTNLTENFVGYF